MVVSTELVVRLYPMCVLRKLLPEGRTSPRGAGNVSAVISSPLESQNSPTNSCWFSSISLLPISVWVWSCECPSAVEVALIALELLLIPVCSWEMMWALYGKWNCCCASSRWVWAGPVLRGTIELH